MSKEKYQPTPYDEAEAQLHMTPEQREMSQKREKLKSEAFKVYEGFAEAERIFKDALVATGEEAGLKESDIKELIQSCGIAVSFHGYRMNQKSYDRLVDLIRRNEELGQLLEDVFSAHDAYRKAIKAEVESGIE